jgi:hypothetical protein
LRGLVATGELSRWSRERARQAVRAQAEVDLLGDRRSPPPRVSPFIRWLGQEPLGSCSSSSIPIPPPSQGCTALSHTRFSRIPAYRAGATCTWCLWWEMACATHRASGASRRVSRLPALRRRDAHRVGAGAHGGEATVPHAPLARTGVRRSATVRLARWRFRRS